MGNIITFHYIRRLAAIKITTVKELNLRINGLEIHLGMILDTTVLIAHKIKKPGLFRGIKKQSGQTIFWSKNCDIQCFADKFALFPNLDTSSGADTMYGTSAYLYFTDNSLVNVTFQLIGNDFAANWIVNKFQEPANETFGQPITNGDKIVWSNVDSDVIIEKLTRSKHAHFHWNKK